MTPARVTEIERMLADGMRHPDVLRDWVRELLTEIAHLRALLNAPPAQMSDGQGNLIPISSEGMRHVIDDNARLRAEVERLRQCRTCGGVPHASGKVCICGGTNFVEEELRHLRLSLFETERERDEALAQVAVLLKLLNSGYKIAVLGRGSQDDLVGLSPRDIKQTTLDLPNKACVLLDRLQRAEAVVEACQAHALHLPFKVREALAAGEERNEQA